MNRKSVAWVLGLLLLGLHLDFWRPRSDSIWFGWIPEELLYRLAWMGLVWFYMLFFCSWIWRDRDR